MVTCLVESGHHPRLRHRDKHPVTISPLESAFTNCDARNPFRIRFYENCRVSPTIFLSFFFRPSLHSTHQLSVVPFFSTSYELQISQSLWFDIHTKCPGGVPHFLAAFVANLHLYFQSLPRCSSRNPFSFHAFASLPGVCNPLLFCSPLNSLFATRHFVSLFSRAWAPPFPGVLKVIQNTGTLSLSKCAVTRSGDVSPLECAVAKKTEEG